MGRPEGNVHCAGKGYAHFLMVLGAVLLGSAVFHACVFLLKGTSWSGFVSWRKPIVFAVSFAITNLTLAWVLRCLPRSPRKGWVFAVTFGLTGVAEVGLITLQQWRGVPSHFNTSSSFDLGVVVVMGVSFIPLLLSLLGISIWSWISLPHGTDLAFGMRIGLLFLIMGQVVGFMVLLQGIDLLQTNGNVAALYPAINAFKIPHAISLHAIQALCVIGTITDRALKNRRLGKWIVIAASLTVLVALGMSLSRAA